MKKYKSKDPKKHFGTFDECLDFVLAKAYGMVEGNVDYKAEYEELTKGKTDIIEASVHLESCWDDHWDQFRMAWYERLVRAAVGKVGLTVYRVEYFQNNRRTRKASGESDALKVEEEFMKNFPYFKFNLKWFL